MTILCLFCRIMCFQTSEVLEWPYPCHSSRSSSVCCSGAKVLNLHIWYGPYLICLQVLWNVKLWDKTLDELNPDVADWWKLVILSLHMVKLMNFLKMGGIPKHFFCDLKDRLNVKEAFSFLPVPRVASACTLQKIPPKFILFMLFLWSPGCHSFEVAFGFSVVCRLQKMPPRFI